MACNFDQRHKWSWSVFLWGSLPETVAWTKARPMPRLPPVLGTKVDAGLVYPKLAWRNMKNHCNFQPAVFFWNLLVPPENCARKRTWLTNPAENCKATNSHEMSRAGIFQSLLVRLLWIVSALTCKYWKRFVCLQMPGEKIWARKLRTAEAKVSNKSLFDGTWRPSTSPISLVYNYCKILKCFHHVWDNLKSFQGLEFMQLIFDVGQS